MKTAFHGLGQEFITYQTTAEAADAGKVCKPSGDGMAAVCASGEEFFGVISHVRDGAAGVQTAGYVELAYTGTAPSVGWTGLVANGTGGVKTGDGHEFLVISVDTTNMIVGFWL